jgi:hypothetical protein
MIEKNRMTYIAGVNSTPRMRAAISDGNSESAFYISPPPPQQREKKNSSSLDVFIFSRLFRIFERDS